MKFLLFAFTLWLSFTTIAFSAGEHFFGPFIDGFNKFLLDKDNKLWVYNPRLRGYERIDEINTKLDLFSKLKTGESYTSTAFFEKDSAQWQVSMSVGKATFYNNKFERTHCTGTMISPTHALLTSSCNDHLGSINGKITLEFGFQDDFSHDQRMIYDCSKYITHNKDLDLLVVQCEGEPGRNWGWVELEQNRVPEGEPVYVIHHPNLRAKSYSTGVYLENKINKGYWSNRYVETNSCHTDFGSSGSLAFSLITNKAIMLNHGKLENQEPYRTMGTSSWAVVDFIESKLGKDFWVKPVKLFKEKQLIRQQIEEFISEKVDRKSTAGKTLIQNETGKKINYYLKKTDGNISGMFSLGAGEEVDYSIGTWFQAGNELTLITGEGREYKILKNHCNTIH